MSVQESASIGNATNSTDPTLCGEGCKMCLTFTTPEGNQEAKCNVTDSSTTVIVSIVCVIASLVILVIVVYIILKFLKKDVRKIPIPKITAEVITDKRRDAKGAVKPQNNQKGHIDIHALEKLGKLKELEDLEKQAKAELTDRNDKSDISDRSENKSRSKKGHFDTRTNVKHTTKKNSKKTTHKHVSNKIITEEMKSKLNMHSEMSLNKINYKYNDSVLPRYPNQNSVPDTQDTETNLISKKGAYKTTLNLPVEKNRRPIFNKMQRTSIENHIDTTNYSKFGQLSTEKILEEGNSGHLQEHQDENDLVNVLKNRRRSSLRPQKSLKMTQTRKKISHKTAKPKAKFTHKNFRASINPLYSAMKSTLKFTHQPDSSINVSNQIFIPMDSKLQNTNESSVMINFPTNTIDDKDKSNFQSSMNINTFKNTLGGAETTTSPAKPSFFILETNKLGISSYQNPIENHKKSSTINKDFIQANINNLASRKRQKGLTSIQLNNFVN